MSAQATPMPKEDNTPDTGCNLSAKDAKTGRGNGMIPSQLARRFIGPSALVIGMGAALSLMGVTPAYADDHDNRGNGARGHGHYTAPAPERHYVRSKPHRSYHAQPVYAPPPDYYRPRPSAGISLFIPFDVR